MKLVSLSKLRDLYYCPTLAYLKHEVGVRFPPNAAMRRGTSLHSFYGDYWDFFMKNPVFEDQKYMVVDFVDYFTAVNSVENKEELIPLVKQRLKLIELNYGAYIRDSKFSVRKEVPVSSFEHGLSGRADFVYSVDGVPLASEVKTGRPSQFDELQLMSYLAMLNADRGFVEYGETFMEKTFSEEAFKEVKDLRAQFESLDFVKPVAKNMCKKCSCRNICWGDKPLSL